jgi:hypothetical protein
MDVLLFLLREGFPQDFVQVVLNEDIDHIAQGAGDFLYFLESVSGQVASDLVMEVILEDVGNLLYEVPAVDGKNPIVIDCEPVDLALIPESLVDLELLHLHDDMRGHCKHASLHIPLLHTAQLQVEGLYH